jgi:hypothetical protein
MSKPAFPMSRSEKRKAARERRKRARQRAGHVDTNEIVLRQISQPIRMPGVVSDMVAPILAPDRMPKDSDGRSPPRGLVEKLRVALGVHALCAYHSLNALYRNSEKARDDVADAAGMSFWHLRRNGVGHIGELTVFNDEDELITWAKAKHRDLPVGAQIANNRVRAEAELSSVSLLGKAYVRTQRIIKAWEEAQTILSKAGDGADKAKAEEQAHDTIENAYGSAWCDLTIGKLTEIAIYADINPVILWPQHISFFAELFELARFVGRINAGIGAELPSNLYKLTRQVMDGYETGDTRDLVSKVIRHHLSRAFPGKRLTAAIDAAERSGSVVSVARGTHQIDLVAEPTIEAGLIGRWQKLVSVLKAGFTRGVSLIERLFGNLR